MWERVRLFRTYQTKVVPGLLQTAAYMTGILTEVRQERGVEVDDIAEAVAERIGRQGYLLQRDRQFVFVIEEPALRFRPYGTAVQRDQLQHLLDMMMLPSVSFGVIPMGTGRRGHRPRESFDITDSDLVTIELLSGFLSLTHPDEIGAYVTAWEHLLSIAGHRITDLDFALARHIDAIAAGHRGEARAWPQTPSCLVRAIHGTSRLAKAILVSAAGVTHLGPQHSPDRSHPPEPAHRAAATWLPVRRGFENQRGIPPSEFRAEPRKSR